ncbi:hypothetical protein [Microbulbifer sp. YPW16]|uniref:hypothetical protein n=1 Tax=unclassified Microbulbifer TaxID=2619833 RepID=UPI001E312354|nr:hypothetical protein [Microbulbifer sp. YPW16]UHQ57057.1 hypothetical protein LVE68_08775 [Microbulbifer sp. YPW16]
MKYKFLLLIAVLISFDANAQHSLAREIHRVDSENGILSGNYSLEEREKIFNANNTEEIKEILKSHGDLEFFSIAEAGEIYFVRNSTFWSGATGSSYTAFLFNGNNSKLIIPPSESLGDIILSARLENKDIVIMTRSYNSALHQDELWRWVINGKKITSEKVNG